jgi:signal peptidase I
MSEGRRGVPARVGIAALNLWAPGLGLLRTGPVRRAILFLLLGPASLALLVAYFLFAPTLGFAGYFGAVLIAGGAGFALFVCSVALTWRRSRERSASLPLWSRWYAILAAALAAWLISIGMSTALLSCYKTYYLPSEAMAPTLEKNDRVVAAMRNWGALRRGDIILCPVRDTLYIKRLAALPGDTIAMRGGIVVLNGRAVPQRFLREEPAPGVERDEEARRLAERFPGEASEHEIYDLGPSEMDDVAELKVPPGFVFVLGDHRDRSADSRVPREEMGVGLLRVAEIRGRALFYYWPWRKMGLPLAGGSRQ